MLLLLTATYYVSMGKFRLAKYHIAKLKYTCVLVAHWLKGMLNKILTPDKWGTCVQKASACAKQSLATIN